MQLSVDRLTGMLIGLAIGDTLGMPLEFEKRGTFTKIDSLQAGGPFDLPLGYWTDDTSMALCLADSILEKNGYDSYDVMDRYTRWHDTGYRSSTGVCFDIGNQTAAALNSYKQQPKIRFDQIRGTAAGNGSIMRLAPIVMASIAADNNIRKTMRLAAVSARETHYSVLAETATALFAVILARASQASDKAKILDFSDEEYVQSEIVLDVLRGAANKSEKELKPTGYVIDTLEVALWAFMTTENFKDGALKTVNMGGDADTIGAVYGQLAGAYYGLQGIPSTWLAALHESTELQTLARRLLRISKFDVLQTRFEEDDPNGGQLPDIEKAQLHAWSNIGITGTALPEPYQPDAADMQRFTAIIQPKRFSVQLFFDRQDYERLLAGHKAHDMEDKWNIYCQDNVVHFHRNWTGNEIFQLSLTSDGQYCTVTECTVEQDPALFSTTDTAEIIQSLVQVLQGVLRVNPRGER